MEKLTERYITDNKKYAEFSGLSTETPPSGADLVTGSLLHEVDTHLVKAWNATAGEWVTQVDLGGASS